MSSLIINIPDDIREVVASEAEQQGLSLQAYIEKNFTGKSLFFCFK